MRIKGKNHRKYLNEAAQTKKGTVTYVLRRFVFGDTFTGGELINPEGKRVAYTIEDTDRDLNTSDNVRHTKGVKKYHPKRTAINAGTWDVKFRRNYNISSINTIDGGLGKGVVPVMDGYGWGGIRFHGGASSRASAGCIILGTSLPTKDYISGWRDVVPAVNKEMIKYHMNGYDVKVRVERDKNGKPSSALSAFGTNDANSSAPTTASTTTTVTQGEMSPLMMLFKLIEAILSMG